MKRFATGLLLSAVTLACQEPAEPPSGPVASVIDAGVGADVAAALDASVVHLPGAGERPEDAALSCEVLAQEHPELASDAYWLNPVFPSPAYHGYQHGPADQINPRFGTEADFLQLIQERMVHPPRRAHHHVHDVNPGPWRSSVAIPLGWLCPE